MEIKAFGYATGSEASQPSELCEVTIVAGPDELRRIADFLRDSADAIEAHGENFDHEHMRDVFQYWDEESTDIIVARIS